MGKWNFSGAFPSCLLPAALLLMAASQSAEAREIIDIDSDAAIDYYERHFDSQGFSRDGTRDGCTPSYEYDSDGKSRGRRTWSTDDAACPALRRYDNGSGASELPCRSHDCQGRRDHHRHYGSRY